MRSEVHNYNREITPHHLQFFWTPVTYILRAHSIHLYGPTNSWQNYWIAWLNAYCWIGFWSPEIYSHFVGNNICLFGGELSLPHFLVIMRCSSCAWSLSGRIDLKPKLNQYFLPEILSRIMQGWNKLKFLNPGGPSGSALILFFSKPGSRVFWWSLRAIGNFGEVWSKGTQDQDKMVG